MRRRPTSTSAFGVSRRESHDSSAFYGRFTPPLVSRDSEVGAHRALDKLIVGDARCMNEVPDSSVALVVTSPPYFAGKEYEESLGAAGAPATYLEYLALLRDVLGECVRKLEPGGRLAVNVANLGRRPYRSLSADVIGILQDDLRLLLRGEIIWQKQRGASGSCAWGSFRSAANPVLRDLTERVIVASKGRFDRALPAKVRSERGLPSESTMTRQDFMDNTLDVWEIPAESATRVGHPAPFPVELPARLIQLYTYRGDLVLDPFVGSGTTAVAAVRTGRHFAGYDLEESYIRVAERRVAGERVGEPLPGRDEGRSGVASGGRPAREVARSLIEAAGFTRVREGRGELAPTFTALDRRAATWAFEVAGAFTTHRPGLRRGEALWKALGKVAVVHSGGARPPGGAGEAGAPEAPVPLVLLTPGVPAPPSQGAALLGAVTGPGRPLRAVLDILEPGALEELRALCQGQGAPPPGPSAPGGAQAEAGMEGRLS